MQSKMYFAVPDELYRPDHQALRAPLQIINMALSEFARRHGARPVDLPFKFTEQEELLPTTCLYLGPFSDANLINPHPDVSLGDGLWYVPHADCSWARIQLRNLSPIVASPFYHLTWWPRCLVVIHRIDEAGILGDYLLTGERLPSQRTQPALVA